LPAIAFAIITFSVSHFFAAAAIEAACLLLFSFRHCHLRRFIAFFHAELIRFHYYFAIHGFQIVRFFAAITPLFRFPSSPLIRIFAFFFDYSDTPSMLAFVFAGAISFRHVFSRLFVDTMLSAIIRQG